MCGEGWGEVGREEVEEEGDGGDDNACAGGGERFCEGGGGLGRRGLGEWCTAFMVLSACLYAWMRARHVPEIVWTAERKNTRRAWNENEEECEVSRCNNILKTPYTLLIDNTYLRKRLILHRP